MSINQHVTNYFRRGVLEAIYRHFYEFKIKTFAPSLKIIQHAEKGWGNYSWPCIF